MDPVSPTSRALPPAAPREPEPYVSPPSFRGVVYRSPVGYSHQDDRPWLLRNPLVLWTLVLSAALVLYVRSAQWLPLVMGHSTTRVLSGGPPQPPQDPFADDAQWSTQARRVQTLPNDLSVLPAPGAGDIAGAVARTASAHKCLLPDGSVEYRQQACDPLPAAATTAPRLRRH